MDLQTAFQQAREQKPRKSRLDGYLENLSAEDSKAIEQALASSLNSTDIARVLTAQGMPIGETSIRRERERRNTPLNGL